MQTFMLGKDAQAVELYDLLAALRCARRREGGHTRATDAYNLGDEANVQSRT